MCLIILGHYAFKLEHYFLSQVLDLFTRIVKNVVLTFCAVNEVETLSGHIRVLKFILDMPRKIVSKV